MLQYHEFAATSVALILYAKVLDIPYSHILNIVNAHSMIDISVKKLEQYFIYSVPRFRLILDTFLLSVVI